MTRQRNILDPKKDAAIRSEQEMNLQFGVSEADYPSVDMGVASQGRYRDLDEFGYEPAGTIEEPGDPMEVDLEPTQVPINDIGQSGEI